MTQQPFSRPGAIDLSALKRPAPAPAGPAGGPAGGGAAPAATGGASAYSLDVTAQNFQDVLERSMTAPVVLVFHSPSRAAESTTYARDVATAADSYEGRFLVGLVDIDVAPEVAQAVQVQQVPLLFVLLDGRPAVQPLPGVLSAQEISVLFQQLGQQLTAQGVTGRHQPMHAAPSGPEGDGDQEPARDPRYAPAEDALERGDVDAAVAEYQRLVSANPADAEAAAGLAMAKVLQRAGSVDPVAVRAAADAAPDDLDAQTLAADVDLLEARVDEAFARLVDLVRRTSGKERDAVREHLLGLFAAVGNADPRVQKGRQSLASALF